MTFGIIETILSIIFIALVVTVLFKRLNLPVILGYLVVGAVIGPFALDWVPDMKDIHGLAEFGVVLLMFTIGLEFSLSSLVALHKSVFLLGGLQVTLTAAITTAICLTIGMTPILSIVVGCIAAMSSTAIVLKQLSEQLELNTTHGSQSVGILLFQDIAVVPILIMVASLGKVNSTSFVPVLGMALVKSLIAVAAIFISGKWLIRPFFRYIANTRVIELFTLSVLLVVIASAWLTHVLGLSFALGSFLAGIMLGETEFRHQIEIEIRPFRDILMGLFFITIGMLANMHTWIDTWVWIALLLAALVFGKSILIFLLCRLSGSTTPVAFRTGLILAQGGEFGFAILTLALSKQLIPDDYGQVILAALLITFCIAPLLINYNRQISNHLFPEAKLRNQEKVREEAKATLGHLKNHVILCGFGRVGQNIGRFLSKLGQPYIAVDVDAELVHKTKLAGHPVIYGDATHPELLRALHYHQARAIVLSNEDVKASLKIISEIRKRNNKLPILARCRDNRHLDTLIEAGATRVAVEIFEESLTIAHQLMRLLHVSKSKISHLLEEVRAHNYDLLKEVFLGTFSDGPTDESLLVKEELRPIYLTENAYGINKTLDELDLDRFNVRPITIRRLDEKNLSPRGNTKLLAGDIVILFGDITDLDQAESILLEG